jgi:hypothetical protein
MRQVGRKKLRILPVPPLEQLLDMGLSVNARCNLKKINNVVVENIVVKVSINTLPGIDIGEGKPKL